MSVYFVQAGEGGRIKIGYSPRPKWRIEYLQRMSGPDLLTLAVIEGERGLEYCLHRWLAAHRHHGEWFEPASAVLNIVEAAKEFPQELETWHKELWAIDFTHDELTEWAASGDNPLAGLASNYLGCPSRHYGDALAGMLRLLGVIHGQAVTPQNLSAFMRRHGGGGA